MTIKMSKGVQPEQVAAKEGSRYAISSPWFDKTMGAVVATDGRCAVVIPVEHNGEETGVIPRDALKAFRKAAPRGQAHLDITADNGSVSYSGITMQREEIGAVPDVGAVIPPHHKPDTIEKGVQHVTAIRLNAKLLAQLAKAMGTESVRLQVTDSNSPLRVDPVMGGEGYGAIMPISGE